jgi:rod shape-determining protein MreB
MKGWGNLSTGVERFLANFGWDIGVDLGSTNIVVGLKNRGIIVDEPNMVARLKKRRWSGMSAPKQSSSLPVAYGYKAKEIFNREPKQLEVISPLKRGIISDLESAELLVSYYIRMVYEIPSKYPKVYRSRVVVGVPVTVNDVQKRAVRTIFSRVGAREVILVEQAILAAVGVGLPMDKSSALMVVDVGGGKTEVNVVSLGGVVVGRGIESASEDWDVAIMNYVKMKYGLLIGKRTAEKVKIEVGNVSPRDIKEARSVVVRGRDLETGLPKSIKMNEVEVREAIGLEVAKVAKAVSMVLDETPPELMEDILKRGIVMVGNGAKLRGLDQLIEEEVGISTSVADEPGLGVIKGILEIIENRELFDRIKTVSGIR